MTRNSGTRPAGQGWGSNRGSTTQIKCPGCKEDIDVKLNPPCPHVCYICSKQKHLDKVAALRKQIRELKAKIRKEAK